ncbi:hypothetical protein SAMN00017477_0097 [Peptoniphilus asaccharolyticus DSM 20463]|uniref:Antitoxin SocA-like Panacea domain-containing protein n=1 Tax=Peptoniphilus asaccharolyticus DSM 20463 TaxID=573058 RepID=A0A1W1UDB5_PEPAS|nr:hypothetical protein [Peptoniphilus asaccharolyticus]MBL7576465.1 hypothetical protein [Peptoniphilus asaccharolyticus]SMB78774.1 hypothetical protein SAMN00017477_0097 [Peptoniphilus asaccharolyticus DSM 20463]
MSNKVLDSIYQQIIGESFDSSIFLERMKMQKIVYLMKVMGIEVGNYNFYWYKYGPYSQELQNDIISYNESIQDCSIKYSDDAIDTMNYIKGMVDINTEYDKAHWLECLGSIYYIKTNVMKSKVSDDKINEELKKRKKHLNNDNANLTAISEINKLFSENCNGK